MYNRIVGFQSWATIVNSNENIAFQRHFKSVYDFHISVLCLISTNAAVEEINGGWKE